MAYPIIEKILGLWLVLGFFLTPFFWIAFFIIPFLLAWIATNFKWLVIYTTVMTLSLIEWNYKVFTIPVEQLEDLAVLDYGITMIFTIFLDLAVILGIIVRGITLHKKYRRLKNIRQYSQSEQDEIV